MSIRQELEERFPDQEILLVDGFDDAIIGVDDKEGRAVYSKQKILEILMEREDMGRTEAIEYYEFNILGAYMGEKTPIYVDDRFGK